MAEHFWEKATGYEVTVTAGFTPLKDAAYTKSVNTSILNFRETLQNVGKIKQLLFGNFEKCLYRYQKFDSDTERRFSIILERDSEKWFKPVYGQFQIVYKDGVDQKNYQPDFVAETKDLVLMIETKARNDMDDPIVISKSEAAKEWCAHATEYASQNSGKPWEYILVPHDEVTENRELSIILLCESRMSSGLYSNVGFSVNSNINLKL